MTHLTADELDYLLSLVMTSDCPDGFAQKFARFYAERIASLSRAERPSAKQSKKEGKP